MTRMEYTIDGKLLPRHLKMFRDEDSGRIELRHWRFHPMLVFLIPFMAVWSGGAIFGCYVVPFLQRGTHPMNYMPFFFGIPFLVVSIVVWGGILLMLFGVRKLVIEHGRGSYSCKLLGIGRTRHFDLRGDTGIQITAAGKSPNVRVSFPAPGNSLARKIRVKNGYRSETICAFWDDDSLDFAVEMLKNNRA